jgi:CubicO group peptidase (beta-lactamase class C family)
VTIMKSTKAFPGFLGAAAVAFLSCAVAEGGQRPLATEVMEKQADRIMTPLVRGNMLSGVVLVAVDDAIVLHKAYGLANREERLPNTPGTKFRIASVTKMFTAVAILQLAEGGRLRLEDKLSRYLPDFPPGDNITLFHLLTHTSGLPSYDAREKPFIDFQGVIGLIRALPLKFHPGESFEYSNSGYGLLAYVIEKVSGESYESYLQRHVFAPTGMTQSGMIPLDAAGKVDGLALGYSLNESGGLQLSEPEGPKGKGEGSLFSTAADMLRFSRALFGGRLVSPKTLERMAQPFKEAHGLGCIVEGCHGWRAVSHPGGMQGVRTSFKTFLKPDGRVVVIDLFNIDFMLSQLVDAEIEKIALGERAEPIFNRKPSRVEAFRRLAGTYEISADETFQITVAGGRIFFQEPGQPRHDAFPFSDTALYVRETNSRYRFTADQASGAVTFVGFIGTPAGAFMVDGRRIREADHGISSRSRETRRP